MTYEEWIVLSSANVWPEDGLPDDYLPVFASSSVMGDPRGNVDLDTCRRVYAELLARGWLYLGPATDDSDRAFVFPTEDGLAAFHAEKDHWEKKWHADNIRKRRRDASRR